MGDSEGEIRVLVGVVSCLQCPSMGWLVGWAMGVIGCVYSVVDCDEQQSEGEGGSAGAAHSERLTGVGVMCNGCGVLAASEELASAVMQLGTIAGAAHIELPSVLLGVASVEQLSSRGGGDIIIWIS